VEITGQRPVPLYSFPPNVALTVNFLFKARRGHNPKTHLWWTVFLAPKLRLGTGLGPRIGFGATFVPKYNLATVAQAKACGYQ
jgi:hypothetical protein